MLTHVTFVFFYILSLNQTFVQIVLPGYAFNPSSSI